MTPYATAALASENWRNRNCTSVCTKLMHDPNRQQLIAAARLLRPLLNELVFLGGCVTGLLITDEAAAGVRSTYDVDAIAEIASYAEYEDFSGRLRKLGFAEDSRDGAPLCRWLHGEIMLDLMRLDEKILGFSNRWYRYAMSTATPLLLEPGVEIHLITAPYFLATKMEAFKGRGKGDFLGSQDLEDLISLIDGRPTLAREVREQSPELRVYVAAEMTQFLQSARFTDALPGHLPPDSASQARIGALRRSLEDLAQAIDA